MTAIDRRYLLLAALGLALPLGAEAARSPAVLAYCTRPERGAPELVLHTGADEIFRLALPGRGHGFAWDPVARRAVLFARRPGDWCLLFDPDRPESMRWITAAAGRHFYGHGCFSRDGALLYASENDFEAARGCIGVYEVASSYRRIGELESCGVGPHDLCMLPNGRLLVANGGIETHPDYGRAKLNLSEMRSSLTILDRGTGQKLSDTRTPETWQKLSLRHLALDPRGRPWFAAQFEGQRYQPAPLAGWLDPEQGLVFADEPQAQWRALEGYGASIACFGERVAVSFPRAQRLLFWSGRDGSFLEAHDAGEAFALAANRERLFVGGLEGGGLFGDRLGRLTDARIDNHARWLV
ncbi:MAG: DUF1513 domain-containing protein [Kiloniellales bacterium]